MKKLLIGVAGLFVALLVGVSFYINEIVGTAIERGGTYALGVETTVGFVRLSPFGGNFRISSLRIANPPGFERSSFLELGSGNIDVALATLTEPVVHVPRFHLDDIEITLERAKGRTNYGEILDNLGRFEKGKAPAPKQEDSGPGTRVVIDELVITDVTANVEWIDAPANLAMTKIEIPEIRLQGIGAHNAQGVAVSELSSIIIKAIMGAIARYGGDLPSIMLGELQRSMGRLTRLPGVMVEGMGSNLVESVGNAMPGAVGDAVRGVGETTGEAAKGVTDAVGAKAKKALGGLFGGDKD